MAYSSTNDLSIGAFIYTKNSTGDFLMKESRSIEHVVFIYADRNVDIKTEREEDDNVGSI